MLSYLKYKAYYNRKAKTSPLETIDYCYTLNPKADTQATKIPFREFRWQGPNKVEKVLPNNNYIVRRLGTNKTHLLHQIRLRKFTPQSPLADIFVREKDLQKDNQMPIEHDDLYAQTWNTNFGPNPFDDNPPEYSQNVEDIEYLPITEPEHNHPPSREIPQISGGNPVEQTTEPDQNYEIHADENPQQISEDGQNTPSQEEPINTCGEKYNLRSNPNPNYSDTYRY